MLLGLKSWWWMKASTTQAINQLWRRFCLQDMHGNEFSSAREERDFLFERTEYVLGLLLELRSFIGFPSSCDIVLRLCD